MTNKDIPTTSLVQIFQNSLQNSVQEQSTWATPKAENLSLGVTKQPALETTTGWSSCLIFDSPWSPWNVSGFHNSIPTILLQKQNIRLMDSNKKYEGIMNSEMCRFFGDQDSSIPSFYLHTQKKLTPIFKNSVPAVWMPPLIFQSISAGFSKVSFTAILCLQVRFCRHIWTSEIQCG